MENIYSNTDVEFSNMNKEEKCSDSAESENGDDDDYENVEEMDGCPTASVHTDFSQSVSLDRVSEQYANATALLKMQENETTELKSSLDKVQESYESASKQRDELKSSLDKVQESYESVAKQRDELKSNLERVQVSYEAASKQLDSLKAKERECKQLEEKRQCMHEVISKEKKSCELCDEGWRSPGLKCYFFSTNNMNWTESRDSCVEKGDHLVIITNQAEQDFLSSNIKETHWMGLNDLETEGKWMWVNNKTLDETGVKFWYTRADEPSEPDNWKVEDSSGENCASLGNEVGTADRWFDASCHKRKKYICEK